VTARDGRRQDETPAQRAAEILYAMTRRVMLTTAAERIRVIEESELTVTQLKALLLLAEQGRQAGGRIADVLAISPAAVSRALDSMVQKGLATRTECADDRRIRLFEATDEGIELATGMANLRKAQIEAYLETVDPDALGDLVEALAPFEHDALAPDDEEVSG